MKMKVPIDLHKGLTAVAVLSMMAIYDNWTLGPWVYLACHGTYGIMWVLKSRTFPDTAWEEMLPWWKGVGVFGALALYWVAPLLLIQSGGVPSVELVCGAVVAMVFGTFLHFGSDAQKYYTLEVRKGLITDGFFARTRNPNYLGEIFIYGSFAALSMHWIPWVILGSFVAIVFVPNMLRKDRSLSRHPEFIEYKGRTGLLLPRVWVRTPKS